MKNLKLALLALSAILVMGFAAQAQLSIHAGGVLPLGDFSNSFDAENNTAEENLNAMSASMGINLGAKVAVPVLSGLKLFGAIDMNYNPLKKDIRDKIKEAEEALAPTVDINFKKYITFPLSAGVEYAYSLGNNMEVFVDGGLVFNCLKVTNNKIEIEAIKSSTTTKSKLATGFGFKVGGGLWFTENLGVHINYFSTGKHEINQETTIDLGSTSTTTEAVINPEPKIGLLTFGVAYRM